MQIITTTDCRTQINYPHFCVEMIFLLKLKNYIWIKVFFPDFVLTFAKKSLIFLTFPEPLTNSTLTWLNALGVSFSRKLQIDRLLIQFCAET